MEGFTEHSASSPLHFPSDTQFGSESQGGSKNLANWDVYKAVKKEPVPENARNQEYAQVIFWSYVTTQTLR